MIETFRHIEFSNKESFKNENGKISLKEYSEDLLLYTSFDNYNNAEYAIGDKTVLTNGVITNKTEGTAQTQQIHIENGYIRYDKSNFIFDKSATFSFFVKPDFLNGKGYQYFLNKLPKINTMPILSKENLFGGKSLDLTKGPKNIKYSSTNFNLLTQEGTIDFFIKPFNMSERTTTVRFFELANEIDDKNKIELFYGLDGKVYFNIFDQNGNNIVAINFDWTFDETKWTNLSINFDINNGNTKFFIDGSQYSSTNTSTGTRINDTDLYLGSHSDEETNFLIDDFAIFYEKKYDSNYTIRNVEYSEAPNVYAKFNTDMNLSEGIDLNYISTFPENSIYSFDLSIDGNATTQIDIELEADDNLNDIYNKIALEISILDASVGFFKDGFLGISSDSYGGSIQITESNFNNSLLDLLDGVSLSMSDNAPINDVAIFEYKNEENDNGKIQLIHRKETSDLDLLIYNNSGVLTIEEKLESWGSNNTDWQNIEISLNGSVGHLFINGQLEKLFITKKVEILSKNFVYLTGGPTDFYNFEELTVYNTVKHQEDFTPYFEKISKYDRTNPYIDVFFGNGFKEIEVKDFNITCSSNIRFTVKIGSNWYYWSVNSWVEGNGESNQTTAPSIMETKFDKLFFNENQELVIRAYFISNGVEEAWIDEMKIIKELTDDYPAIIIGTVSINDAVDLSSDQHVMISTEAGDLEVDLTSTLEGQPAVVESSEDLSSGHDWSSFDESFEINGAEVLLNQLTSNLDEICDLIRPQLPTGIEIYKTENSIGFKTTETGSTAQIDLFEINTGLDTLGFVDDVYEGSDPDLTSVTINDIKNAINSAGIPGLAPVGSDDKNRLILMSENKGSDAYIGIFNGETSNAIELVWGFESSDSGEDSKEEVFDYSYIFNYIREQLGAPTVPVELTDDQLRNCVSSAAGWYNYYRSDKKDRIKVFLKGNNADGYELPEEVPSEDDILEIILKPQYPILGYSGKDADDILNNIYIQHLYRNSNNVGQMLGDYYITLSTQKDFENILGRNITWDFYNKKLFIHPDPKGMEVGIVFKSALSVNRINTDTLIKSLALAKAKIVLGNIRSTFGGSIPGGGENIQLNGEALKAEGKEEEQSGMEKLIDMSEPLFMEWG
jgi:hypothetical protein